MTRETKIGLLLGMCVILLIGIIISDQLSQPQQDPADFTDFAAQSQRSIDASDANPTPAPGFFGTGNPGIPGTQTGGTSPVIEPPSDFFIPSNRLRSPGSRLQANNSTTDAPAISNTPGSPGSYSRPLTLNNVNDATSQSSDDVTTVRIGQNPIELPHHTAVAPTPTHMIPTRQAPTPRGRDSAIRHTVLKGETLTRIAQRYYGNGDFWRTIAKANPDKVTRDGRVRLGAVLNIPKRDDALRGPAFVGAGSERLIPVRLGNTGSAGKTIQVKPGDTLSELAAKHLGSASKWQELLDANSNQLDDPESLRVGMKLRLPGTTIGGRTAIAAPTRPSATTRSGKTYTVRANDNLTDIAEKTLGDGNRWRDIFEANRDTLKSPDRLGVGQKLRIPR